MFLDYLQSCLFQLISWGRLQGTEDLRVIEEFLQAE
jgi:hypothetical protein